MLRLALRAGARQDIFDIIQYGTAEHGVAASRAYVGKLRKRINWLRENPKLDAVYPDFDGQLRSFREGQHRIYYAADERTLVVVRILHVRSNAERHLH